MSDIKARIPPSPRLSARMTNRQYLIETVTIKVQTMSERMPMRTVRRELAAGGLHHGLQVYNGLVPRSPKTTPKALKVAHWPACALGVESRADGLIAITAPYWRCLAGPQHDGTRKM